MRQYRKEKLASVIRSVVGNAITQRLHDPRVAPLTTVTRVELTQDLMIARVYVSVPGGDSAERRTTAALRHAAGFVQRLVAHELTTRHCPEIRFAVDESLKIARHTLALLDEVRPDDESTEPRESPDGDLEDVEEVDVPESERAGHGQSDGGGNG